MTPGLLGGSPSNKRLEAVAACGAAAQPHRVRRLLMTSYRSNDEFFQAVDDLSASLDRDGHNAPAADLRRGLASLNGLTDGWALLLEAVENVQAAHGKNFSEIQRNTLASIRDAAHAAVYRR